MGYINQPFDLRTWSQDIDARLRKLETAVRFTAPDVPTEPTYPRTGDIVYNNTADYVEYWNGTEWVIFGDNNVGSPLLTYNSTWSGTGLTYTGTPTTAVYQKIGAQIHFHILVNCSTVTNFGTGGYKLTLPMAPARDYVVNGGIHHNSDHYNILGDIEDGTTTMNLWYQTNNGSNAIMKYNQPHTITTADYFYVGGNYLIA